MADLHDFILDRVDDDEPDLQDPDSFEAFTAARPGDPPQLHAGAHARALNTTRLLFVRQALRRIIALHDVCGWEDEDGTVSLGCSTCGPQDRQDGYCETVLLVAWPYHRHPDYDPAWRPPPNGVEDH